MIFLVTGLPVKLFWMQDFCCRPINFLRSAALLITVWRLALAVYVTEKMSTSEIKVKENNANRQDISPLRQDACYALPILQTRTSPTATLNILSA